MSFDNLQLPQLLVQRAHDLGWQNPSAVQSLVIPKALEGFDILAGAPTGTGKTAAFLLPIISKLIDKKDNRANSVIILEPTRELAMQVANVCKRLIEGFENISVGTIIGGEDRIRQKELASIIVATPGRLQEFINKQWLDCNDLKILVIDEADRMLDMGFVDEVLEIAKAFGKKEQTMLFSATLEGYGIREFSKSILHDPIEFKIFASDVGEEKLPELLSSRAYYAANDTQKLKILIHLIKSIGGKSIIFVKTKDRVDSLYSSLSKHGIKCATLKGQIAQNQRTAALKKFIDNEILILIATDVASRGIDVSDLTHVYNYDLPSQAQVYVHRAGRTARAGQKGVVISLVLSEQIQMLSKIERYTQSSIERRNIKGLCAAFPVAKTLPSEKRGRTSIVKGSGFDKKSKQEKEKKHIKIRHRVKKNKGKPDLAAKRAKKLARAKE